MLDLLFYVLLLALGAICGLKWVLARAYGSNRASPKIVWLSLALISYLFFFLASLFQGWEFPAKVLDIRSGSPAEGSPLLQDFLKGDAKPLKVLVAQALTSTDGSVILETGDKKISWRLGTPENFLRQSASDISRLFLGLDFFSRRPIPAKESFLFFQHQGFEIKPRSVFVGVGGEPVSSVAEFKSALEKMPGDRAFPVQLSVRGLLREAVANFQQKPFFSALPDPKKRLDYFGLVDWGFPLRGEIEKTVFMEGFSTKDLVLLGAAGKAVDLFGLPDLKEGDKLLLRLPLQGEREIAVSAAQAEILKNAGIRLQPELAFPIQFSATTSPFLVPLREWWLRLERAALSWQIFAISDSFSQIPWRREEIEFTFWQSFTFWMAIGGNLFFLLVFYYPVAKLFPKLEGMLINLFPLFCVLYHFHELFIFRVLR